MRRPHDYLRGSILVMVLMIMGTASLVGFLALSRASLSRIQDADNSVKAFTLRSRVYGCMEEVLIQWQRDINWSGTSVTTGLATCTVTVTSPAVDQKKAAIRHNADNYYFGVDVTINTTTKDVVELIMSL